MSTITVPTAQPTAWNWGVTGVSVHVPKTKEKISATPAPWDELQFDPLGAYDLRRHLGVQLDEEDRYMNSRPKFEASDVAWLASGACADGQHKVDPDQFFREFDRLRAVTARGESGLGERKAFAELTRRTIFDLATKLDRAIGSTTMVLHIEGTVVPGSPIGPEYLKSHVYLPPSFIRENPNSHPSIAAIVQLFIENIGVPTTAAWTRRAHRRNWPLSQPGAPRASDVYLPLIPAPLSNSAHYIFLGRPVGAVTATVAVPAAPVLAPPSTSQVSVYDIDEIELDAAESNLLMYMEENAMLKDEVSSLTAAVAHYSGVADEAEKRVQDLQAEIQRLEADLRQARTTAARSTPVSSPVRRFPATPTRPPSYGSSFATPSRRLGELGEPSTPRGVSAADGELGAITHEFLINEGLMEHYDAIRLICRVFHPVKWAAEVDRLSTFPEELKAGLLLAFERDGV